MPTIDNWRALREAISAGPTNGPWRAHSTGVLGSYEGALNYTVVSMNQPSGRRVKDVAYIAAADPTTIRALLDERDRLAAEVDALRADALEPLRNVVQQYKQMHHWRLRHECEEPEPGAERKEALHRMELVLAIAEAEKLLAARGIKEGGAV